MSSTLGGAAALVIGLILAVATAFGVVESQQSAGEAAPETVSYGSND